MKKIIILLVTLAAFSAEAQTIKSITDKAEKTVPAADQSSFIDDLANDQVKKLTKKLNLSDEQQTLVSGLVVSQLKSEKFQKLIGSFTPSQLMSGSAKKEVTNALVNDEDFKKEMSNILTDDQKDMVDKSKSTKG